MKYALFLVAMATSINISFSFSVIPRHATFSEGPQAKRTTKSVNHTAKRNLLLQTTESLPAPTTQPGIQKVAVVITSTLGVISTPTSPGLPDMKTERTEGYAESNSTGLEVAQARWNTTQARWNTTQASMGNITEYVNSQDRTSTSTYSLPTNRYSASVKEKAKFSRIKGKGGKVGNLLLKVFNKIFNGVRLTTVESTGELIHAQNKPVFIRNM